MAGFIQFLLDNPSAFTFVQQGKPRIFQPEWEGYSERVYRARDAVNEKLKRAGRKPETGPIWIHEVGGYVQGR